MASRKEQKEALRERRLEEERAAARAERRRKLIGYAVGGVLALAAIGALVFVAFSGAGVGGGSTPTAGGGSWAAGSVPPRKIRELSAAAQAAGCMLRSDKSEGNAHTQTPVNYKANPPHSGNHAPDSAEDGAYLEPPYNEGQFLHALEHGRIHLQFRASVPDGRKGNLKALFDEDPYHMVVSPNLTNMPYEVAATAWTKTLACPRANDKVYDAIRAFKDAYRDRGPEFVQ